MRVPAALIAGALLAGAACNRAPRLPEPVPEDPRLFTAYMLEHLPDILEKVTCHCCRKTLHRCYRDMHAGAPGHCPFG